MRPIARLTMGLSPTAMMQAYVDWAIHLANRPGKRMQLVDKAVRKTTRLAQYAAQCAIEGGAAEPCIEPLPQDRRFDATGMAEMAVQRHLPVVPAAISNGGTTPRPACAASASSTSA